MSELTSTRRLPDYWRSWPLEAKLRLRDELRHEAIRRGILQAPDALQMDKLVSESDDWRTWLSTHFPTYVTAGFAPRHVEFWNWVWAIRKGQDTPPFVAIWPRGGAKSTSGELAAAALGVRGARRYCLYVCETQAQADNHVQNIASLLERLGVARAVNKYGSSKGWRRNRIVTSLGFTVDALGLDVAARGAKLDEDRPCLMIFDDIDGEHDTEKTTEKKTRTITNSILPAGTADVAVLMIQNMIIATGVFAQLAGVASTQADYLVNRILSGPHPAIENLQTRSVPDEHGAMRVVITGGTATWAGQDIAACQKFIDKWGFRSFDKEAQHNVGDNALALWTRAIIAATRVAKAPEQLDKIVVGVDPPGTTARCGIVVAGRAWLAGKAHGYTLEDASTEPGASPAEWATQVVARYHHWKADEVVVETNMGGAMVKHTLRQVKGGENIKIVEVTASRGKRTRAEPISTAMAEGRDHHVGIWADLENLKCRWVPGDPSPDALDAEVWAKWRLLVGAEPESSAPRSISGRQLLRRRT